MSRHCSPLLLLSASVALLSGCVAPGMGGLSMNATISGGQTVRIDFDNKGVVNAEDEDIRVEGAMLEPNFKTKKLSYRFTFREKHEHGETPKSVRVDDVTDDTAVNWVVDEHPQLDAKGVWLKNTDPVDVDRTPWINEIESSIRVYRFTITTADGRTLVLYEGASLPANVKKYVREQLGLEKVDKH